MPFIFDQTTLTLNGHTNGRKASITLSTDTFHTKAIGGGQDNDPQIHDLYLTEFLAAQNNVPVTYCIAVVIEPATGKLSMSVSDFDIFQSGNVFEVIYFLTDGLDGRFGTPLSQPAAAAQKTMMHQQAVMHAYTGRYYSVAAWRGNGVPNDAMKAVLKRYVHCMRIASQLEPSISAVSDTVNSVDTYYGELNGVVLGQKHYQARAGYQKDHNDQMYDTCTFASQFENASALTDTEWDLAMDKLRKIILHGVGTGGGINLFEHIYNFVGSSHGRVRIRQFIEAINTFVLEAEALHDCKVARVSYEQFHQYYFFRRLADDIDAVEYEHAELNQRNIQVTIPLTDKYPDFQNTQAIRANLSFFIDLSGTQLAGNDIHAVGASGIESLGGDKYNINVPFPGTKSGTLSVMIKQTDTPEYMDFTPAVITSSNVAAGVLTLNTDKKTKATIWRMTTGSEDNLFIHGRSNKFQDSRELKVQPGEYRISVVTPEGKHTTISKTVI